MGQHSKRADVQQPCGASLSVQRLPRVVVPGVLVAVMTWLQY